MKKTLIFRICLLLTLVLASGCSSSIKNVSVDDTQSAPVEENMVEGELLELSPNELLIRQEDGTEITLNLSNDTVYWEGIEWLTVFPVIEGDQITAYGEWTKDLTGFNVDQYYNNRLFLKGIVTYESGETEGYMINQPDQDYLIFNLPQRTKLLTHIPEDPRSFKYFKMLPHPGEYIEVVGRKVADPFVVAVSMTRFE